MTEQTLSQVRRTIRPLLDRANPADALAVYYAFYHSDDRTQLFNYPRWADRARGYLAVSRTGIDLFRSFITMRLPEDDPEGAADLIYEGLQPGTSVFIHCPMAYRSLLSAFFQIQSEQQLYLFRLDPQRFEPIVNVLVTRSSTPGGLPRFIIRPTNPQNEGEIGASASLNWQTPDFAEVTVYVNPQYRQRGWGRSVVAALVDELLRTGHTPLYEVSQQNEASINLAKSLGFVNTGADKVLLEGTLRDRP